MDALGYPLMPNFGGEAQDNSLGSPSVASTYSTNTSTPSENTNPTYTGGEFSAHGRSDISVILDQLMSITDQVISVILKSRNSNIVNKYPHFYFNCNCLSCPSYTLVLR